MLHTKLIFVYSWNFRYGAVFFISFKMLQFADTMLHFSYTWIVSFLFLSPPPLFVFDFAAVA